MTEQLTQTGGRFNGNILTGLSVRWKQSSHCKQESFSPFKLVNGTEVSCYCGGNSTHECLCAWSTSCHADSPTLMWSMTAVRTVVCRSISLFFSSMSGKELWRKKQHLSQTASAPVWKMKKADDRVALRAGNMVSWLQVQNKTIGECWNAEI